MSLERSLASLERSLLSLERSVALLEQSVASRERSAAVLEHSVASQMRAGVLWDRSVASRNASQRCKSGSVALRRRSGVLCTGNAKAPLKTGLQRGVWGAAAEVSAERFQAPLEALRRAAGALRARSSSERIRGVELDSVPSQEPHPLLLEATAAVMLLLALDVPADVASRGLADAEGRVALLPAELPGRLGPLVDPARGIRLDRAEEIRHRQVGPHSHQQVHMVRHAADPQQRAAIIPDGRRDERVEVVPQLRVDEVLPVPRAEDDVVEKLAERVGHGRIRLSGDLPKRSRREIPWALSYKERKNGASSLNFMLS